ncbi:helix-turn-helix domain-containing protein [Sphingobacterium sp. SG20118]|uniref:helix-turn-helix domain-containing protein n=1 Tax=Sphingobacterium sp. SG20118 TaxID=3367156 RepID=UPI0037DFBE8A
MVTLGEKLKELREANNLMQKEIGILINVGGAFISKIERNETLVSKNHLKTLSGFFSVKEEELMTLWLAEKIRELIQNEYVGKTALETVLKDFEI